MTFGQRQLEEGSELLPHSPTQLMLAFPSPNQLFLFDGQLFHGVLRAPPGRELNVETDRLTLPLNWWQMRPYGPLDLPSCFEFNDGPSQPSVSDPSIDNVAELQLLQNSGPEPEPEASGTRLAAAPTAMRRLQPTEHCVDVPFITHQAHLDSWRAQRVPQEFVPMPTSEGFADGNAVRVNYAEQPTEADASLSAVVYWPL